MITYINKENAEAYRILFDKATALLKEKHPDNLGISDWENFKIGTLNEYFAYLQTLVELTRPKEEQLTQFIRLPLDEDLFEINADTRVISIPSNFSRNGAGVKGDEVAEVLYFSIDRFFDNQDLANTNIAIQWQTQNPNREIAVGFSPNFGKQIVNLKDKDGNYRSKIIFGWPIARVLTEVSGTIKFAVRFYTGNDNHEFEYSLTTLPAEIRINDSLDYKVLDNSVYEVRYGEKLLNRIKSAGIYDPYAAEMPDEPTITTQLYALSSLERIIDLPADGSGVELAIAARPTTTGIISYTWNKYSYQNGEYSSTRSDLPLTVTEIVPVPDTITTRIVEVTEDVPVSDTSDFYNENGELVILADSLEETNGQYIYNSTYGGFKKSNASNSYMKIYREFNVATVHGVGKYSVTVAARAGANTAETMSDTITIPGPLKPAISFPEGTLTSDNIAHIIADGDNVTLSVAAHPRENDPDKTPEEVGQNPQVSLSYNWKEVIDENTSTDVVTMPVAVLPVAQLPDDPAWLNNTDNGAKGIYNQQHISISQNGTTITVYPDAELEYYLSTNEQQGEHQWVALDVDTGKKAIAGTVWDDGTNPQYIFTDADEHELGIAAGHLIFWFKVDEEVAVRTVDDTELTFIVASAEEKELGYGVSENELEIKNLPDEGILDKSYFVEVTSTRNGISTADQSGIYRITRAPEKPEIQERYWDSAAQRFKLRTRDYQSENNNATIIVGQNENAVISFAVVPPVQSEKLSYVWMKLNARRANSSQFQIDLDDAIEGLDDGISNPADTRDTILRAVDYFNAEPIGDVADENFEYNGPKYSIPAGSSGDIYYCIVINELNGHVNANVSWFFTSASSNS